ncbi:NADH-quinone oxidoreductase subunit NuoG [Roseomonas sp. NAR14]|uniref:NADH-quinone oxidoreductase n=1 Tax=Roseomonas acroporae TaxID=2937791 RepID=A0A9X1Y5Y3_9PROT|nr:NADH-quinone oxidoreductase subunit NuoG [Roseomonas acroporae]MCK8782810.1 NADH-quinone oxidoreductase subunit NuoG [Roseomonas acroporae]
MAKVTVDGIEVEVPNGSSVIQACEAAGKEIPRFCYHERLSVAGNCRMCLVEVEKVPKPVSSCSYPVADGMVVKTDSPMARNGRRGVMEFLLINHPLDCPICDQGGECDLQDEAVAYGADHSRYMEEKRAVKEKHWGPLVKTVMTRCIQCTRCIRFATEIAGVPELGATNRGENMEVGTYVEKALTTELSGNLIDLCPVGALTSRPYAFVTRPWELRKTDSVDVLDAVGASIRVDARGPEILRVLPRTNEAVNEEWLADRSRFAPVDAQKRRRLDRPWVKRDGALKQAEWVDAFKAIADRLKGVSGERIGAVAGDLVDAESVVALKDLMTALGSANLDCRQDGAAINPVRREFYTFNTTIAGIEEADALLIIGSNPRLEAPVLNARIRKRSLLGKFPIGVIGEKADLTYGYTHLGDGPGAIGNLGDFAEVLSKAERPMLILGRGALARPDGAAILGATWRLAESSGMLEEGWNGFNLLHRFGGQVGALDLGFVPGAGPGGGKDLADMLDGGVDVLWLLGADEFDVSRIPAGTFVIYQGHHGDRAAARADVILPGATYLEKDATYVNTEGRVQRGRLAVHPPGEAREDWRIIRAASELLGHKLSYDDLAGVRRRLAAVNPVFGTVATLARRGWADTAAPGNGGALDDTPFAPTPANYWQVGTIGRASPTMAECAATYLPAAAPSLAAE